ncbi:MAG: hypothetical protein GY757_28075 [bacterium]|nr:hypothetical protein [bacterium]
MAYIPTYERKARAEGLQEGMEKGKLDAARALLVNGVDINIIAKSTGLSRKKLEALAPTPH